MKKMLSVLMTLLLLITMVLPYAAAAETGTQIAFHSYTNTENGIRLVWTVTSASNDPQSFLLVKNGAEQKIEASLADELIYRDGSAERTYEYLDTNTADKEVYTYSIKLENDTTLQTEPITIVHQKENGGPATPIDPADPADEAFLLHARAEGTSIAVSWPAYKSSSKAVYQLYQSGTFIGNYPDAGEHIFRDLEPDTDYSFTLKIIADEKLIDSREVRVRTEAEKKPAYTVFFYPVNETTFETSWFLDGAAFFDVYLNGKLKLEKTKETEYQFTDLKPATEYEVKVTAFDQAGKKLNEAFVRGKTKEAANGKTVQFKDSALKRAVKDQLRIQRDVTESDLEKLTYLNASAYEIKDLTGLHHAVNLQHLELAGNSLRSIEPLRLLTNLEYLDLSMTGSLDYSPLNDLVNLKSLVLADSSFKDTKNIEKLTKLKVLDLSFTNVKNVSSLSSLSQLEEINLSYIPIKTIQPLQTLTSLKKIILYGEVYLKVKDELQQFGDNLEIIYDDSLNIHLVHVKPGDRSAAFQWEYEGDDIPAYYEITVDGITQKTETERRVINYETAGLKPETVYSYYIKAFEQNGVMTGFDSGFFTTLKTPAGEKAVFPDANLRTAMKNHFGLKRDIYESDMETLTELDLTGEGISDLTGLESAKNLKVLVLSGNSIKTVKPIESLSLTSLHLDDNRLEDLSSIIKMQSLQVLNLSNTGIKNFSALAGLKDLTGLSLAYNGIADLSAIPASEKLSALYLNGNKLSSLKGIEKVQNLTELSLEDNPITDIEPLTVLRHLQFADLSMTSVKKIEPLLSMDSLVTVLLFSMKTLDLSEGSDAWQVIGQLIDKGVYVEYDDSGNLFSIYTSRKTEDSIEVSWDYFGEKDIDFFKVLVNGETASKRVEGYEYRYWIRGLKPETAYDIEVKAYDEEGELLFSESMEETTEAAPQGPAVHFKDKKLGNLIKEQLGLVREIRQSDMAQLTELFLLDLDITSLKGLESAGNLQSLFIHNNGSELNLQPLKELNLVDLSIENTEIKNYKVIQSLSDLSFLAIKNNQLQDLSFLSGLDQLVYLDLSKNNITDLTALSGLGQLEMLQLNHNQVKSISKTLKLENLQHLELAGNPLKDLSGIEEFESLATVIFERTKLTNIDQLLSLENLELVSLFGIETLDLSPGSRAAAVVEELRACGVKVWAEASFYPEIHITDVTKTTISFSWDNMLEGDGTYTVYVNGEMQGDEPLPAETTFYHLTGLEADTAYFIEVFGESGEFVNAASKEVTTLSEEEEEISAPEPVKPDQENGDPVSGRPINPVETESENKLPKTASMMYQSVFFGTILMMSGAAFLAARRKRG